jgi:hypothetical protein
MPGLQKLLLIVDDQFYHIAQLPGAKTQVLGECHGVESEFARQFITVDMHVGWFVGFMTVKI